MVKRIVTNMEQLKLPCANVGSPEEITEVKQDIRESFEVIGNKGKVGLAANQIGIQKKVALVQVGLKEVWLINPVIVEHEGRIMFKEACLSLPGLPVLTDRYERILLENGLGEERKREYYEGYIAIVIQHETDHLNGKTILDRKHRRK